MRRKKFQDIGYPQDKKRPPFREVFILLICIIFLLFSISLILLDNEVIIKLLNFLKELI